MWAFKAFVQLVLTLLLIKATQSYRVDIAVVIDEKDNVAERALYTSLNKYYRNETHWITHYQIIKMTKDMDEATFCGQLFSRFNPSLLIDATRTSTNEPNSGTPGSGRLNVRKVAKKLGMPTVSTALNFLTSTAEPWQNLEPYQEQYLISVQSPAETMPNIVEALIEYHSLTKVAVLFDSYFPIEKQYLYVWFDLKKQYEFYDLRERTFEKVVGTLDDIKSKQIKSIFVFGQYSLFNSILESLPERSMLGGGYMWYMITMDTVMTKLRCEKCNTSTIKLIRPFREKKTNYEHKPFVDKQKGYNRLYAAFYYDLTDWIVDNIKDIYNKSKLPYQLYYPSCGETITRQESLDRQDFKLRDEMSIAGHWGMYGLFRASETMPNATFMSIRLQLNKVELFTKYPYAVWESGLWDYHPNHGNLTIGRDVFAGFDLSTMGGVPVETLATAIVVQPPFIMKAINSTTRKTYFFGYSIELLEKMRAAIYNRTKRHIEFDLYESPDGKYGDKDEKGNWDGLVQELLTKRARVAMGPVLVMAERESVIDFTVPYYDLVGISLLMKKPISDSHIFKFLTVLNNQVWTAIFLLYCTTSVMMFILDRLSPYSYHNSPHLYDNDLEKRKFTLKECFWFCITSMTPQGGGIAPKNYSGRLLAGTWWLFSFSVISVYTANLAAFLTVARLDPPLETLEHLSDQYRVSYATVKNTVDEAYFWRRAYIETQFFEVWKRMAFDTKMHPVEQSLYAIWHYPVPDMYKRIYDQMRITGFPKTYEEGVRRVRASDGALNGFALVAEATKVRWTAYTNCDLIQSGNEFSRKPLALGVQENDTIKEVLSSGILQLLNERKLEAMKEKWWNENPEKKECEDTRRANEGISIKNIGGVFVIILVGVIFALVSMIFEYLFIDLPKRRKQRSTMNVFLKDKGPGFMFTLK